MADTVALVTGASGFLGQSVMKLLAQNAQRAIGLDPRPSATTQVIDDLSDRTRLAALLAREKITHIIHAGGVSGPMVMADDPAGVITINVTGSMNLLYEAMAAGVTTFVYCSSVAAIGNFYEREPIGEDYPMRPTSTYGCSKAAMDSCCAGCGAKCRSTSARCGSPRSTGPDGRPSSTSTRSCARRSPVQPARLDPLTDWPYVYVDDAAEAAIAACFAKGRKQLAYFIAHPERVTPDDIAAACGGRRQAGAARDRHSANRRPRAGRSTSRRRRAISAFARKSATARAFAA